MKAWLTGSGIAACLLLTGCGGGGSGSSSPPVTVTSPAPTPTPSPTPTASPIGRAFSASASVCMVRVYSTAERAPSDPDYSGGNCSRDGTFGLGVTQIRHESWGLLAGPFNFADHHVTVFGIDGAGATPFYVTGPQGSRIYSPVTSLMTHASQPAVKAALGLDGGIFALSTNPDLTLFDPLAALAATDEATQREGARVIAANLRAKAIVTGLNAVAGYGGYDFLGDISAMEGSFKKAAAYMKDHPVFIFTNERMTQLLTSAAPAGRYKPEVLSAAAHLVDAYAGAIGVQVSDTASAARFNLGLTGYLRMEIDRLLAANSVPAANQALAVTTQMILDQTLIYRQFIPLTQTGFYFPGSDFLEGSSASPLIVETSNLRANDFFSNDRGALGFYIYESPVVSVTVPSASSGQITAVLSGSQITVNAVGGFTGRTYFDYVIRHESGEQGSARVYITFR